LALVSGLLCTRLDITQCWFRKGGHGLTFKEALEKSARTKFSREDDVRRWVEYWGGTVDRNEDLLRAFMGRARIDFDGKTVLDIGCGTGGLSTGICGAGGTYLGLDFHGILDLASILISELGLDDAHIGRASATHLPLQSKCVDYVIAFDVIEHLVGGYQWQLRFLREIRRVLKPEGVVLMTTQNKLYPMEGHTFLPFPQYLPAPIADMYVKWRNPGFFDEYESFREVVLLSPWKLRRLIDRSGLALLHELPWCMDLEDHPPRKRRILRLLRRVGLDWAYTKGFWFVACNADSISTVRNSKSREWLRV
jgi:SAM-dependent methyltransferase